MNIPKLKYGNCFLFSFLFWLNNKNESKMRMRMTCIRGIMFPSFYCIYKDSHRIGYRSRPKGNGSRIWFKGRPQIIKLEKLK